MTSEHVVQYLPDSCPHNVRPEAFLLKQDRCRGPTPPVPCYEWPSTEKGSRGPRTGADLGEGGGPRIGTQLSVTDGAPGEANEGRLYGIQLPHDTARRTAAEANEVRFNLYLT